MIEDFEQIFKIMHGLPVTIRLLDPPLHEFLPKSEKEITEVTKAIGIVNVNSWIECAHYVNGGWNNINYQNFGGDQTIFIGLLFIFSFYIIAKKFIVSDD